MAVAYNRDSACAWAAGLFEGEGCIHVRPSHARHGGIGSLSLQSTDRDVLERFAAAVGVGHLEDIATRRYKPHHKPSWRWHCGAATDVRDVLVSLLPYLGVRRAAKAGELIQRIEDWEQGRNRTCVCGASFVATNPAGNMTYCSARCRKSAYRARAKEGAVVVC